MLHIGINTDNVCGQNNIEIAHNISKVGFRHVMLSYATENVDETITTLRKLGLDICYYHIDNREANNLWAMGDVADAYVNNVIGSIEMCAQYNIPIAVMHATYGSPSDLAIGPNEQGLKNFQKILNVAKKYNVIIAIENTDYYGIKHFNYLLDNIKDKNLRFCYDVGHHYLYYPQKDLLKKYADRLVALHLHDNLMDWCPGFDYSRDLHLLPYDGAVDFDKVCKKLNAINYKGIVMLEIRKRTIGNPNMYENISSIDFLKEAHSRGEKLANRVGI